MSEADRKASADYAAPSWELLEELVLANHILFDQGVVDAFGHVSVRHDKRSDRFFLARNMAPGRVATEDLLQFDLDGEAIDAIGRKVYLERFIHAEIYRRRPDVAAIVHSHSHSIVPLSVIKGDRMQAVLHTAGFVGQGAPVFEIRETAGDCTDLLISSPALGRALAEKFDGHDIVLMRGHGSTVVAQTLQQVVFRAVYAEANARCIIDATRLGEVVGLSRGESQACVQKIELEAQRPWELWAAAARTRRGAS